MTDDRAFDDVLDSALDALGRGGTLADTLFGVPRLASELRPLLEMALATMPAPPLLEPQRLESNFSLVRDAVREARARAGLARRGDGGSWWRRPLTFASVTLPAGAFALLALGAGGAAAATVAVNASDAPAHVITAITPNWAEKITLDIVHSGGRLPASEPSATSAPGADPDETSRPEQTRGPIEMSVSGAISGVHGNVFTLTSDDGAWKVNIDGTTEVVGTIADGATATVDGDVTAENNLRATRVDVTSAPEPASTEPPEEKTPGPPGDRTPHGGTTPPGQEKTPPGHGEAPGPPDPPPGQSSGNGGDGGDGGGGGGIGTAGHAAGGGNANGHTKKTPSPTP